MFRPRRPQPLPASLRARIEASLRDGVGLSKHEWILSAPVRPHELAALGEAVVEWSRLRVAESRRPYGIDQSALALACAHPGGVPLASATFGVFRPIELYAEGGISEQVQAFLKELPVETLNDSGEPIRFAVALFSWGDVARATLFAGPE